jgi:hypothetical protein
MSEWLGIDRKRTPVDPTKGVAYYAQNTRLVVGGGIQRRRGMAKSNLPILSTAIIGIAPANPAMGNFLILQGTNGSQVGQGGPVGGQGGGGGQVGGNGPAPAAGWGDQQLRPPTGTAEGRSYSSGYPVTNSYSAAGTLNNSTITVTAGTGFPVPLGTHSADLIASWTQTAVSLPNTYSANSSFAFSHNPVLSTMTGGSTTPATNTGTMSFSNPFNSANTTGGVGLPVQPAFYTRAQGTLAGGGGPVTYLNVSHDMSANVGANLAASITMTVTLSVFDVVTSSANWTLTVNRATDWDQAYDIYAKVGSYPAFAGDGVWVGLYVIAAGAAFVVTSWIAPSTGAWKFIAVAQANGRVSAPGRLT